MKKLVLAKETLRCLSSESIVFVRGGVPQETQFTPCIAFNTEDCESDACPPPPVGTTLPARCQ